MTLKVQIFEGSSWGSSRKHEVVSDCGPRWLWLRRRWRSCSRLSFDKQALLHVLLARRAVREQAATPTTTLYWGEQVSVPFLDFLPCWFVRAFLDFIFRRNSKRTVPVYLFLPKESSAGASFRVSSRRNTLHCNAHGKLQAFYRGRKSGRLGWKASVPGLCMTVSFQCCACLPHLSAES